MAAVNGTAALHISLLLAGVTSGEEVITQPVSFIATCNAISYCGAHPVFVDVDRDTMGMSPEKLEVFLQKNAIKKADGWCYNSRSGKRFAAVVPMHTFGHPCQIDEIAELCRQYNIPLVEDAAESLGSRYQGKHTGLYGKLGAVSFNGNKIITTGGGGMLLTDDEATARLAKHLTTTAKLPHRWEYYHDYTGYNYRLTNLAAALGCGQVEQLENFVTQKRKLAKQYNEFFKDTEMRFFTEPATRPIWTLSNRLPMYQACQAGDLSNAAWLEDRVVNIPSSVIIPDYYQNIKAGKYV